MWRALYICAFAGLTGLVWSQDADESWVVSIAQGPVRGFKSTSFNVFEFLNIPYATAPTGKDRFKAPLPPPTWDDTFNATNRGIRCPQPFSEFMYSNPFTEDCLVANIFVPATEQKDLPVLVLVHGGGYHIGDGLASFVKARGFVESQNIIVVTLNYRLSVHGFLCLGTETAPGNAGMKDQVALLRWVKDNIASFGGKPDDVTISGCSAGGSSVDTLLLSNLTNGLFNKVIAESGCSTAVFGAQLDPLQNAKDHVHRLNFTDVDVENITAVEEFYTTSSWEILTIFDFIDVKDSYLIFQPCVERDIGQEIFLDDAPMNIIRSGYYKKVPILYGYAHKEGMIRLPQFEEWKVEMNENFSDFLPADLEFENKQQKEEVAQAVKQFYFGNNTVNEATILSYVNYFGDVMFITAVHRAVTLQVQANNSEVYLYDYSFVHNGSLVIPHTDVQGADHCDQVLVILDTPFTSPEFLEMSISMRQVYSDFIHTGNPTPPGHNFNVTWLPAGPNRSPHLSVGSSIELLGVPLEERAAFWDSIYERHYRMPIPPNPELVPEPNPEPDPEPTPEPDPEPTTEIDPEPNAAVLHLLTNQYWIMFSIGVFMIIGH